MNASDTQKTELVLQNLEPQPGTEKNLVFFLLGTGPKFPVRA